MNDFKVMTITALLIESSIFRFDHLQARLFFDLLMLFFQFNLKFWISILFWA